MPMISLMNEAKAGVRVGRVYDPIEVDSGPRVLVDRLWPRGVGKEELQLERWAKQVAPSDPLRMWYHHDVDRFAEFRRRYLMELQSDEAAAALKELHDLATANRALVLLTATGDVEHSHAAILADVLQPADG